MHAGQAVRAGVWTLHVQRRSCCALSGLRGGVSSRQLCVYSIMWRKLRLFGGTPAFKVVIAADMWRDLDSEKPVQLRNCCICIMIKLGEAKIFGSSHSWDSLMGLAVAQRLLWIAVGSSCPQWLLTMPSRM